MMRAPAEPAARPAGSPLTRVPLCCPLDGMRLELDAGTLGCANGHRFDVAREGHVNLLPHGRKPSRAAGDSQTMVAARRRVFDDGLFEPLHQAVLEAALPGLSPGALVVDAGCGEGRCAALFAGTRPGLAVLGVDVSRPAIRSAARRYPRIAWVIANHRHLPLAPASCDLLLSLFGFADWPRWAAQLPAGARVLCVDPGPDHLLALRERIYPDVRRRPAITHAEAFAAGFTLEADQRVAYVADCAEIDALLEMTPHGRRVTPAARDALLADPPRRMPIDVQLRIWRRDAA